MFIVSFLFRPSHCFYTGVWKHQDRGVNSKLVTLWRFFFPLNLKRTFLLFSKLHATIFTLPAAQPSAHHAAVFLTSAACQVRLLGMLFLYAAVHTARAASLFLCGRIGLNAGHMTTGQEHRRSSCATGQYYFHANQEHKFTCWLGSDFPSERVTLVLNSGKCILYSAGSCKSSMVAEKRQQTWSPIANSLSLEIQYKNRTPLEK